MQAQFLTMLSDCAMVVSFDIFHKNLCDLEIQKACLAYRGSLFQDLEDFQRTQKLFANLDSVKCIGKNLGIF